MFLRVFDGRKPLEGLRAVASCSRVAVPRTRSSGTQHASDRSNERKMSLLAGSLARKRPAIMLAALLFALIAIGTAGAAAPNRNVEFAIKATYLYKFSEFIEWPTTAFESGDSPATVCVVGDDPFGATLDKAIAGKQIAKRSIAVKRMAEVEPHSGCQVMYIANSPSESSAKAMDTIRGENILTITDGAVGDVRQGIINFVIANNRVRFEIDDHAAAENGLVISSKLLALATSVKPKG